LITRNGQFGQMQRAIARRAVELSVAVQEMAKLCQHRLPTRKAELI
jgi:hypothetical protein